MSQDRSAEELLGAVLALAENAAGNYEAFLAPLLEDGAQVSRASY